MRILNATHLTRAALVLGALFGAQAAFAIHIQHYNIENGSYAIHDIVVLSKLDNNATGITYGPNNTDTYSVAPNDNLTISTDFSWFPGDPNIDTSYALILGIATDLPGDASGQKHAVVMMNDAAAQAGEGIGWGTLFPNTDEDQLISDIENSVGGNTSGFDGINGFFNGDALTGIHSGDQVLDATFTPGDHFTIETWSNGTIIGQGTSSDISVPEPASLSILGLGAVGLLRRRRKG